jgi:acyl carrier protein phosphodiesterase
MFWDHCLAKRWYEFDSQPLEQFCNAALEQVMNDEQQQQLPERFVTVTQAMWQGQWLSSYQHIENIEFALQRMSNRSARMARLADCFPYLERNYHQLDELFTSLYPQILTASKSF